MPTLAEQRRIDQARANLAQPFPQSTGRSLGQVANAAFTPFRAAGDLIGRGAAAAVPAVAGFGREFFGGLTGGQQAAPAVAAPQPSVVAPQQQVAAAPPSRNAQFVGEQPGAAFSAFGQQPTQGTQFTGEDPGFVGNLLGGQQQTSQAAAQAAGADEFGAGPQLFSNVGGPTNAPFGGGGGQAQAGNVPQRTVNFGGLSAPAGSGFGNVLEALAFQENERLTREIDSARRRGQEVPNPSASLGNFFGAVARRRAAQKSLPGLLQQQQNLTAQSSREQLSGSDLANLALGQERNAIAGQRLGLQEQQLQQAGELGQGRLDISQAQQIEQARQNQINEQIARDRNQILSQQAEAATIRANRPQPVTAFLPRGEQDFGGDQPQVSGSLDPVTGAFNPFALPGQGGQAPQGNVLQILQQSNPALFQEVLRGIQQGQ